MKSDVLMQWIIDRIKNNTSLTEVYSFDNQQDTTGVSAAVRIDRTEPVKNTCDELPYFIADFSVIVRGTYDEDNSALLSACDEIYDALDGVNKVTEPSIQIIKIDSTNGINQVGRDENRRQYYNIDFRGRIK